MMAFAQAALSLEGGQNISIDCKAGGDNTFGSVRPSVHPPVPPTRSSVNPMKRETHTQPHTEKDGSDSIAFTNDLDGKI